MNNTGVQIAQPNLPDTTVVGVQQGTSGAAKGFQYGYSVTQYGSPPYSADKSGKDDNFRGESIFHDTLYVSKGSGGKGIDTVSQVGATGMLPVLSLLSASVFVIVGIEAISLVGAGPAIPRSGLLSGAFFSSLLSGGLAIGI